MQLLLTYNLCLVSKLKKRKPNLKQLCILIDSLAVYASYYYIYNSYSYCMQ